MPERVIPMSDGKYAVRLPSRDLTVLANNLRQALALNTAEDIIQMSRQAQQREARRWWGRSTRMRLPAADLAALDECVRTAGFPSRTAALQRAIFLLRQSGLERDYEAAWREWGESGERTAWDGTIGDGAPDAER